MTAYERPVPTDTGQRFAMHGQQHRRISDDVASLDSWTDALNLSSSLETSGATDENRLSGSGRAPHVVNVEPHKQFKHHTERVSSVNTDAASINCDVADGAGPITRRHLDRPGSGGQPVHINRNTQSQMRYSNHPRTNYVQPDTSNSRGMASWFNNITQSRSQSPNIQQYRPHALSTSAYEARNVTHFGISAQSRLGLPHTNITNAQQTNVSSNIHGHQQGRRGSSGGEFGSENLVDQLDREGEKLKTRFLSAWNNVKYGWTLKTKTNFKCDSPIFLLGKCYHRRGEGAGSSEEDGEQNQRTNIKVSNIEEFHQDFSSRMWFTYRREFSPLPGTKMTTDCGWGCMLRSGQMMLAQALVSHFLGRDWRVYHEPRPQQKAFYKEIIRWFSDQMSDQIPFSIHKLVDAGQRLGKSPGDWYGPSSVALILRDALIKANSSLPVLNDVCIYVAQDCTVYKQDVFDLCLTRPKSNSQLSTCEEEEEGKAQEKAEEEAAAEDGEWKRAAIIFIPMRLGGESLNPIYIPCVKSLLTHDNCIGIIGGKPKHSLYFVGWQEDKLINLDPHYCQDVVDTTTHDFPVQSFHCVSPRKLSFTKMDPSCTVGFYIRTKAEFDKFVQSVSGIVIPPRQKGLYPLFIFSDGRSSDLGIDDMPYQEQGRLRIRHYRVDRQGNVRSPTIESEDFVIL
ncbi:cysteine protease ATG4D-like [Haliotis cracherodii]|uniref:cysteine protease ATG4D-like n=1 Tax=Haliotis cracherodii TaxID=6455 RepID=UPI0039E94F7D